jgi:hypothetical protein
MGIPEFQRQHEDPRGISLARLVASEFGSSEDLVRRQLNHGSTVVEINGKRWTGNKHFIPRQLLKGRTLAILGPERHWQMHYPDKD